MCDSDPALIQEVQDAMEVMFNTREPFTTMDISKPIIVKSVQERGEANRIRHGEIRGIINHLWANGILDPALYTTSAVTVYPEGGQRALTVRLFHPDDPAFDPASYTATHQKLDLSGNKTVTRNIQMDDVDDADDGSGSMDRISVLTTTSTGAAITKQCQIQMRADVLNIPKTIVVGAGFSVGDSISTQVESDGVHVTKDAMGKQQVDAEGRIRLHGKNVSGFNKGTPCTAMVIEPTGGDKYIQVQ